MEKIEIYASNKKLILLLIGSILGIFAGGYFFINAEDFTSYRSHNFIYQNLNFKKTIGILIIIFCGLGVYVSIKILSSKKAILIIDKSGININPRKSSSEIIQWKNINSFSELKIQSQKFIIINVNNSDYWIEKEKNKIRKRLMKYNLNSQGSPFNLSVISMKINHIELLKILNENFNKYKV